VIRSRSQRVYLRHPEASDFDEMLLRYRASHELFKGVASAKYDRPTFERLLESADTDTGKTFLICVVGTGAIAGQLSLSQIFYRGFQNAYLGYHLFSGFTGHGYMTEAVSMVLRYAFDRLKLHRIEANVQPTNLASIAVLKRNGFIKEGFSRRYLKINGRWRDHERWAIIAEDWRK
jgi:ribosomal-protein-alanine N-acetyltransferase